MGEATAAGEVCAPCSKALTHDVVALCATLPIGLESHPDVVARAS